MKKKLITTMAVFLAGVSLSFGATMSSTVGWNVPSGDRFRERVRETLDAYETQINLNTAGATTPLASNKVFIGNSSGIGVGKTLTGDLTVDIGGTNVIGSEKITSAKIAYGIDAAKLKTNSTPPVLNLANGTNLPITVTKTTGAVTASGANGLVTPTATITPQTVTPAATMTAETGAVTASGANEMVTPTATITPYTGAVTASGANDVVTPTATMTLETFSLEYLDHSTNAQTILVVTNATCAITPDLASNTVVTVSVTGGDAVWTNATCAITPDLASNAVVVVAVTGGDAVWTNATCAITPDLMTNAACAITPDLASNAVVAVSVTGGGAVVTDVTAANP